MTRLLKFCMVLAVFLSGCSEPTQNSAPDSSSDSVPKLSFHGFLETLEIAPVLLAVDQYYPHEISVKRGGIQNLYGVVSSVYGDAGIADIATNAETQLLRYSVDHPELRMIMTVTEGNYRIVARRSAGINSLADLKGKRVGTLANTSAAYFLERMLNNVELVPGDVTSVTDIGLPDLSAALVDGRIDALAMWSPETEEAEAELGADAIGFSGEGIYREIFNLNTTAQALADPEKRAAIKTFLKSVISASEAMAVQPLPAQRLVVERMAAYPPAYPLELIAASWSHHNYVMGTVPDFMDVLVEQEQWIALNEQRAPRDRETLAQLVDYSLLEEILAEGAAP